AIIGGGLLGTCISYWLSSLYDIEVIVIEKEPEVAMHTSSRNTGVVHSPFYLNPEKKGKLAKAAFVSHDLWKRFAEKRGLAWKTVGTLEIALDDTQHKILEKYLKWGVQNGISEKDLEMLDRNEVTKKEPNVSCHSAVFCKTDVAVDYGKLTQELKNESQKNGTKFLLNHKVESIENKNEPAINFENKTQLSCDFVINCAGGYSLDIAKKFGLAVQYSSLHFRGEYWIAQKEYTDLVKTNIYSVPNYPDFPFLDPHWILRADGRSEVGPNAVPVPSPETYSGYVGNVETFISKLIDVVTGNARNLLLNADFMNLVAKEWLSSVSKVVMIERIQKFIPKIKPEYFLERGTAGIRTPIITPEGKFLPDVMEIEGPNSHHILNYNSPGATGAPAYSAYVVKSLQEKGLLDYTKHSKESIWNFEKIT
ncbi:FAD-dependent oxidoreductase, partial [Candidatus Pacearchaeota archaeon]|nr:FAD-dependent oxidoreductase [Candidatus Pacearchaeota archaeon]